MADKEDEKFYALYKGKVTDVNKRVFYDILVLTPFDKDRKHYHIKIPAANVDKLFVHPDREDVSWMEHPGVQKFKGYKGFGPGILVVRDNIRFGSLETKLYGEKDPFSFGDDSSDESGEIDISQEDE